MKAKSIVVSIVLVVSLASYTAVANTSPVAKFNWWPHNPRAGQRIRFNASDSYSPYASINKYWWDFTGNGQIEAEGKITYWKFDQPGIHWVGLQVQDTWGNVSDWRWKKVQVSFPALQAKFSVKRHNLKVEFDATRSQGQITHYRWNFGDGRRQKTNSPLVNHYYDRPGGYRVTLTVYDKFGRTHITSRTIRIQAPPPPSKITYETQIVLSLKDLSPEERMLVVGSVLVLSGLALIIASASG